MGTEIGNLTHADIKRLARDESFIASLIGNERFAKQLQERIISPMFFPNWVKPSQLERMSGITATQFKSKVRRGRWAEGVHFKRDRDGVTWINWKAIDEWVSNE